MLGSQWALLAVFLGKGILPDKENGSEIIRGLVKGTQQVTNAARTQAGPVLSSTPSLGGAGQDHTAPQAPITSCHHCHHHTHVRPRGSLSIASPFGDLPCTGYRPTIPQT